MIYTDCHSCCFFHKDKGCAIGQMCYKHPNGEISAPGYCRIFRSFEWATKANSVDLTELHKKAIDEAKLKLDLLILFCGDTLTKDHLQYTINDTWFGDFINKIIIADTTGPSNHKRIALEYFKNLEDNKTYNGIPVSLDIAIEKESEDESPKTVYRLARKIQSPFFMVIPAGRRVSSIHMLEKHISLLPTRAIHWNLPVLAGKTLISVANSTGLYITEPYKELSIDDGRPFVQQLREDQETGAGAFSLSWLCENCWLV